jgi:hypothetical protein
MLDAIWCCECEVQGQPAAEREPDEACLRYAQRAEHIEQPLSAIFAAAQWMTQLAFARLADDVHIIGAEVPAQFPDVGVPHGSAGAQTVQEQQRRRALRSTGNDASSKQDKRLPALKTRFTSLREGVITRLMSGCRQPDRLALAGKARQACETRRGWPSNPAHHLPACD